MTRVGMRWVILVLVIIVLILVVNRSGSNFQGEIPRIIHQTAPADKKKWLKKFPNWEYKFWSDEDLENLIRTKYPWFLETYKGYDKNIKRIDAARYFILYEHGGLYADMDFECVNNFEHLIPNDKISIAESPYKNDGRGETHQNALMMSPPKHPFWENIFKLLEVHKNEKDVLYATGPQLLIKGINAQPHVVNTLDSKKFAPEHDDNFKSAWKDGVNAPQPITDTSIFTRHHGTGVWGSQIK
jgi:mannosyltransferase OCH1-like enzyme